MMETHSWVCLRTLTRPGIRGLAGLTHGLIHWALVNPQLPLCRRPFFPSRLGSTVKSEHQSHHNTEPLENGKAKVTPSQGEQSQTSVCREKLNSSLVQQGRATNTKVWLA